MNKKLTVMGAFSVLLLVGCGGGSSGGGNGGSDPQVVPDSPTTVSGRAADGYLSGATVCLDINTNKRCDTGEPSSTTGAGGAFSLDVPAGTDANAWPLVVEVGAGVIDEDTGLAVSKPFLLSSPAGKGSFISPMTTAVQAALERNPALSVEDAEAQVKQSIAASDGVSLFEDYVAGSDSNSEYKRLHRVAQVVAKVLAENQDAIEAAAASQGLDLEQVHSALVTLVTNEVLEQLQQSADEVDTRGDTFDIDTVTVTTTDTTNLTEQVAEVETQASFQIVNAVDMLTQGVSWLWAESDAFGSWYEYGSISQGASADTLQEQIYAFDGVDWRMILGDEEARYILGPDGWAQSADDISAFTVGAPGDNSARLQVNGHNYLKVVATTLDVTGQPITDYLGFSGHTLFANAIVGTPVFSSGARVYQPGFLYDGDQYVIETWQECDPQNADPSGGCNIIYGTSGSLATQLSDVIYPSEPSSTSPYFGVGDGLEVIIMASNNLLRITDRNNGDSVTYSTWSQKTVHGKDVMILDIPDSFSSRLWDDGKPFLAVRDGYVRRGHFQAGGTPDCGDCQGELLFNQTALDDILANVAIDIGLQACYEGDTSGFTASFATFESAVQTCSTAARAIAASDVAGMTWTSADSGETLAFAGDGTAVLDGVENMTWTIDADGNLEMWNAGQTYYDVYALVSELGNQISVKVYNDDDSDGNIDRTGSDGQIWSAVYTVQ